MGAFQRFLHLLAPFIMLGIVLVALTFGIFMLAYLFFFGIIVGFVLFLFNQIRRKFTTRQSPVSDKKKPASRIIDSDDWKVL